MKVLTHSLALAFAATSLVGATAVASADASAAPAKTAIQIRHQTVGCHSWSVNGGPYKAAQSVRLARGGSLTIADDDVMTHQLIRVSGPKVVYRLVDAGTTMMGMLKAPYAAGMMPHTGATLSVTFAKKGVYTFKTAAGEDYMKGVKTTGPDNVLKLTVTVS
jgi:hypothetical protein